MAAAALALAPAAAAACPQCASRDGGGLLTAFLLGGMILLPFAVFWVVLKIIRRGASQTESQP